MVQSNRAGEEGIEAHERRLEVAEADLQDAFRVGMDCLPEARRQVLLAIIHGEDVEREQMSRSVRERQPEEMDELGLIEKDAVWRLSRQAKEILAATDLR